MHGRRKMLLLVGGVLTAAGTIVFVVYLFQPWRSCAYEDTSAGCAMLPDDARVMMSAFVVALLAIAIAVVGLLQRRARATEHARSSGTT